MKKSLQLGTPRALPLLFCILAPVPHGTVLGNQARMASVEQTDPSKQSVISLEKAKAKPAAEVFDIERKLDLDEDAHRAELQARLGLTPEDIVTRVVIFSCLQGFALAFMGVVLVSWLNARASRKIGRSSNEWRTCS